MYSTHQKGVLGELEFALHLISQGYTVLQPMNPNSSYDIVTEKDGIFNRVQVKYLTLRHGILRIELERPKRQTLSYRKRGVDAIGVFESTRHKFYLIPIAKIPSVSDFWLRVTKPKNSQVKNINFAEKFEI